MCKPISDIPTCMIGQLAQEVFVGARQLGMRSFRKVLCHYDAFNILKIVPNFVMTKNYDETKSNVYGNVLLNTCIMF